jgi:hypothetical protein
MVLDDALIAATGEHVVEGGLDPWAVERRRRVDKTLLDVDVDVATTRAAAGLLGRRDGLHGAGHDGRGRGAGRPAVVDEPAHRPKAAEGGLVVDPVAARRAGRRHDAVATLPCPQHRDGEPSPRRSLLDGVHASSSVLDEQALTSARQNR